MGLRLPEQVFLGEIEVLPWVYHQLGEPKGGEVPRQGGRSSVWFCSHFRMFGCPRLGGSAFFENCPRDPGVSSKAHKFACELRALLASDKHLGSAERSERQLQTNKTPAGARGTVADLRAAAAAADPAWDSMSGERESRGRLCEHIARF